MSRIDTHEFNRISKAISELESIVKSLDVNSHSSAGTAQHLENIRQLHGQRILEYSKFINDLKDTNFDGDLNSQISKNFSVLCVIGSKIKKLENGTKGTKNMKNTTRRSGQLTDRVNTSTPHNSNRSSTKDFPSMFANKNRSASVNSDGSGDIEISIGEFISPTTSVSRHNHSSPNLYGSEINMDSDTNSDHNTTEYIKNISNSEAEGIINDIHTERGGGDMENMAPDINRPTIINFWADWCGYSNKFLPAWNGFVSIAKQRYPNLQVLDMNVKHDNSLNQIATNAGVSGYPTIVLFRNNKKISAVAGGLDKNGIQEFIDKNL